MTWHRRRHLPRAATTRLGRRNAQSRNTLRRPRSAAGIWARTRIRPRRRRRSGARRRSGNSPSSGARRKTRPRTTIHCTRTAPKHISLAGGDWVGLLRRRYRRRDMRRRLKPEGMTRSGARGRLWRWRGRSGRVRTGSISTGARSHWI